VKIKDNVLFLQPPEKIPEEEPGKPENIGPVPDTRFLANIIPCRMIDVHCPETVGI
jgi:hypothetical protein